MRVISYTDARNNLKAVLDDVVDDFEPTVINRRDADNAVIMSESEFNAWQETVHLMSSPKNAARLYESIEQHRAGNVTVRDIIDE